MKTRFSLLFLITCLVPLISDAAHPAAIKEYERAFTTYPYSDPDPVPSMSRFYPYFRYDGFTDTPVQKKWKVVELSNDYLQLMILPEIGGKVWAAIDKTTGKSFVYFNQVVKFRDVSMRGPWTSGGMEPNYGIVGHTPNCFSPVDYVVRRNRDGSASCIVGVLDLLTRSTWRLEINLPADQACFTTRSFWHNSSENEECYYTWMNIGIKTAGNLEFVAPGNRYLDHDGSFAPWPVNPANGHQISWYNQNNFGSYKSYHVFGGLSEFFGGYWHDEDFGMAHYAPYGDKPGRKFWVWGLSREGMIWENLLTDTDGQYVEVQSGRHFNQGNEASSLTPFKHMGFAPFSTDSWKEYWMPVKGTKGFVSASPWGALNVSQTNGQLVVHISPVRPLRENLEVFDGDDRVYVKALQLHPMQPVEEYIPLSSPIHDVKVCVGGDKLQYTPPRYEELSRPVTSPTNFNWNTAYGLYVKGKEEARQRSYVQATEDFRECLKLEPNFSPALVEMASLANRRADNTAARDFAVQALRVDTYDPGANYQLGLAATALGNNTDAKEAFSIAALNPAWRSAASFELAKLHLREHSYERSLASVQESLDGNPRNVDSLQLRASIQRLQHNTSAAKTALKAILDLDPLNHFARFERYLQGMGSRSDFMGLIRNELPHETYLELAIWYHKAGLDADAVKVLELALQTAEVLYWQAYLCNDTNRLQHADAASPAFVFPSRPESVAVFDWAAKQSQAWQPRYYLALLRWHQGELTKARELLAACKEEPRFGPFYAARAQVCDTSTVDLQKAAQCEPNQWRYGAMLAREHLKEHDLPALLKVTSDYTQRFPGNNVLAVLHAKALVLNAQYQPALDWLNSLHLLPCEGSTEAHSLYREAHLMLASGHMKSGTFTEAQTLIEKAREWPERLGAGKPYPENTDERLEDWLKYQCDRGRNLPDLAQKDLDKILNWQANSHSRNFGTVIRCLALKERGQQGEATGLLENWAKEQPANEIPKWGLEILAGHATLLSPKNENSVTRVLNAIVTDR